MYQQSVNSFYYQYLTSSLPSPGTFVMDSLVTTVRFSPELQLMVKEAWSEIKDSLSHSPPHQSVEMLEPRGMCKKLIDRIYSEVSIYPTITESFHECSAQHYETNATFSSFAGCPGEER